MAYGEGALSASDVALINGRNNDGGAFGDGNWAWIIVLFLIFGWGRNGFGNFGNNGYGENGSTSVYEGYVLNNDFSQLSRQISDSYSMTERKLDGINNGLCSLGYQELQNINGVNTNISNGVYNLSNAITTSGYETRNAITQDTIANMQNTNALQTQLANCCCDIKGMVKDNRYDNAQNVNMLNNNINSGFVSMQQANCLNTRDIISSQENGTRKILEAITSNKIEDLKEANRQLTAKNASLELAASQAAQNEYLLNNLRNGCPVNAQLVCGNQPIPVQYVAAQGCNCNGCGCN